MKIFKVRFHQHYKLKKQHGFVIVTADNAAQAEAFAKQDLISKLPGYAYAYETIELCTVREDRCSYVASDFFPIDLSMYNE